MSISLEIHVKREDGSDAVLLLEDFARGITSQAMVAAREIVMFPDADVQFYVEEIVHCWRAPGSQLAPNSVAVAHGTRVLRHHEWDKLLEIGFREI